MFGRLIAIGDIHGCAAALDAVLVAVRPTLADTVVTLGDYIDRGPDSRGVIARLQKLAARCQLVPLLGNHDEMVLRILAGHAYLIGNWLAVGGDTTLASYGVSHPQAIPAEHLEFLARCRPWHETDSHFFVHASYHPRRPMKKQPPELLRWESIIERLPGPHRSGKVAVVGHSAQRTGEVLDLGYLKCIDTWVYGEGWLTAIDLATGQLWQADRSGTLR